MISRTTTTPVHLSEYVPTADRRIVLGGVSWEGWQSLLAVRGESGPRMAYLDGVVEIMSPSRDHEVIKSGIGRLVEAYCFERGITFSPVGSWLLDDKSREAGAEPDECYVFGRSTKSETRPDLVIEVIWTSGGLDKLEIYRRLGVREVWFWKRDVITVHVLGTAGYEECRRSACLPDLDLDLLTKHASIDPVSDAVTQFRAALRG